MRVQFSGVVHDAALGDGGLAGASDDLPDGLHFGAAGDQGADAVEFQFQRGVPHPGG